MTPFLRRAKPLGLMSLLILGSCAGHVAYDALAIHLAEGNCDAAIRLVEESQEEYGTNSELLFLLDSAMVHMQCQNFETAQERFHGAEDLAQQLWTLSLSQEILSLIANDYLLTYGGEDYERAMIHLMSAIAYLDAALPEDALVECRRLDSLLTLYNDRYDKKMCIRKMPLAGIFPASSMKQTMIWMVHSSIIKKLWNPMQIIRKFTRP